MFALCLTLHSLAFWLRRRDFAFVASAAAAVVIFRGELALLFGTIVLTDLLMGTMSLVKVGGHQFYPQVQVARNLIVI